MAEEPKIDIPIPPQETDKPVPVKTENLPEKEDTPEPKLKEVIQAADIAVSIDSNSSRLLLEFIKSDGKLEGTFKTDLEQLRKEGETDVKKVVLAIDFEMGFLLRRVKQIGRDLSEEIKKGVQPDSKLGQEAEEIIKKIQTLREERKNFPEEPNQLTEFAKVFGVGSNEAEVDPFGAIQEKIILATTNEEIKQEMFGSWDQLDFPQKEEIKQFINKIAENVRVENENEDNNKASEKGKKYGKRIAVAGAGVGLAMILSAWFAMKMESPRKQ